jgi:hypothetical protein
MALKIGSEDKKKVAIVASLAVVVVIVFFWQVYPWIGGSAPSAPLPPTVVPAPAANGTQPATQPGTHEAVKISGSLASLDPTLHPEWMAAAESLVYAGKGRNIFSMSSVPVEIETLKGPVRPNAQRMVAQGPPPPPPIDLKFFGYEAHTGGQRKVFLLHGDDVFIASVGDVVDHRYKVVQIAPFSIQIEDIPYNNTQTLPLIQN